MDNELKQRKQIRLKDFDYLGPDHVYFLTICTANKSPYFLLPNLAKIIKDELYFRGHEEIKIFCYCIMLDHVHILMSLKEGYQKSLSSWVAAFKRYTARVANECYGVKPLWLGNFYDHVVRQDESLLEIAQYILDNPVRKNLTSNWEEYQYCEMVDSLPI